MNFRVQQGVALGGRGPWLGTRCAHIGQALAWRRLPARGAAEAPGSRAVAKRLHPERGGPAPSARIRTAAGGESPTARQCDGRRAPAGYRHYQPAIGLSCFGAYPGFAPAAGA